jgi:hypothetical protein
MVGPARGTVRPWRCSKRRAWPISADSLHHQLRPPLMVVPDLSGTLHAPGAASTTPSTATAARRAVGCDPWLAYSPKGLAGRPALRARAVRRHNPAHATAAAATDYAQALHDSSSSARAALEGRVAWARSRPPNSLSPSK